MYALSAQKIVLVVALIISGPSIVEAASGKILHTFQGIDGSGPIATLVVDPSENIFGTANSGSTCGGEPCGLLFGLSPRSNGQWGYEVLYQFVGQPDGGGVIAGSRLALDGAGNLYGMTNEGGANNVGAIFKLARGKSGNWVENILHSFTANSSDGFHPSGGLIFDSAGNMYGTTGAGGTFDGGTVFELTPANGGGWTETVIYNFPLPTEYGTVPTGQLIFDSSGNLYGITSLAGDFSDYQDCSINFIRVGCGTVFQLVPPTTPGAEWTENVLYEFHGQQYGDGERPTGFLTFDSYGNLYGVTAKMVYQLSPRPDGEWTETILRHADAPQGGVVFDTSGNLYGAFYGGGAYGYGGVFKLSPGSDGSWTSIVLHSFTGGRDGADPFGGVVFDSSGNLLGTTYYGGNQPGSKGDGVVFQGIF